MTLSDIYIYTAYHHYRVCIQISFFFSLVDTITASAECVRGGFAVRVNATQGV